MMTITQDIIWQTMENLQKHRFQVVWCEDTQTVLQEILKRIPQNATIGWGGSQTVKQIGLMDAIIRGPYRCLDRNQPTQEARNKVYAQIQNADYFISGANAITYNGEIINMDGRSDRVAFLCFGPKHVFIVAGINKLVPDIDAAIERIRTVAAPMNATKLGRRTPCVATGNCTQCNSPECVCCNLLIGRCARDSERTTVFLVNTSLGY